MKKQNSIYIALVIILVTSLACNLGKKAPVSNFTTPTALSNAVILPTLPAPFEMTPTAIPEPLPSSYSDLMENKLASGAWTLEVGLVTILKMFAGEIQASDGGLEQGVFNAEGTGILQLADNYLQTGSDQTTKDEITRLINLLVPTQESLDRFSIPEEQAMLRGGSDGLAAEAQQDKTVAFTTDRSYQTEQECKDLWVNGFPDPRLPSFPCFMFGEPVAGQPYQVYYPLAWRGDASREPYYRAALDALRDSINTYKPLFTIIKPISIVFSPLDGVFDALTYYYHFGEGESCPIIIHPSAIIGSVNIKFNQLIAHEIAHCFTAWNLERQYLGSGTASKWWSEGMAEYFSNVVYPSANAEHQYSSRFAHKSTTISLIGMEYENFAFFQFLGNRIGSSGVIAMLQSMPTTPGRAAQRAALAAVPGIDDTFEEFTRTIMENTLKDTDGSVIYIPDDIPEDFTDQAFFSGVESQDFSGKSFVVARYLANFPSEKSFTVEVISGGVGRSAWHPHGSRGEWKAFPAIAAGKCEELVYSGYVITTNPSEEPKETISITSVTPDPCDKCLVGRWEATNDSVVSYMQSVAKAGSEDGPTVESVTGTMFMQFGADGIGSGGFENLIVHETGVGGVASAEVFVTFEGFASGPYTADGSSLSGLTEAANILVTVKIPSMGSTTIPFRLEDFPVSSGTPTRYTCEGDTLTMWPPAAGSTQIIYTHSDP